MISPKRVSFSEPLAIQHERRETRTLGVAVAGERPATTGRGKDALTVLVTGKRLASSGAGLSRRREFQLSLITHAMPRARGACEDDEKQVFSMIGWSG